MMREVVYRRVEIYGRPLAVHVTWAAREPYPEYIDAFAPELVLAFNFFHPSCRVREELSRT